MAYGEWLRPACPSPGLDDARRWCSSLLDQRPRWLSSEGRRLERRRNPATPWRTASRPGRRSGHERHLREGLDRQERPLRGRPAPGVRRTRFSPGLDDARRWRSSLLDQRPRWLSSEGRRLERRRNRVTPWRTASRLGGAVVTNDTSRAAWVGGSDPSAVARLHDIRPARFSRGLGVARRWRSSLLDQRRAGQRSRAISASSSSSLSRGLAKDRPVSSSICLSR